MGHPPFARHDIFDSIAVDIGQLKRVELTERDAVVVIGRRLTQDIVANEATITDLFEPRQAESRARLRM